MSLFEYLKKSWDIKDATEDIILMFLECVRVSVPILFAVFFIKLYLIIFW